ncbi:MAG: hypothetical protein AEth_01136 [Candidatus Argoarchaeum ethanivorans]|uniref:Uncharacterized protein n=1 Tax=Candidatus Argoarchaeum ethanivorans TaxID=2608793 RepID=A0A8B3S2E3_9EURY|nr:MAG: hypothetical protein AEth_01136 [Candidatus Argoarchaeum ethanivorans]
MLVGQEQRFVHIVELLHVVHVEVVDQLVLRVISYIKEK